MEKEEWPGAGFYIGFEDLKEDNLKDLDQRVKNHYRVIEQQIERLSDTQTKIGFLKRCLIEIQHKTGMRTSDYGYSSFEARGLYGECRSALHKYEQLALLEADDPETESSSKEQGTAAQQVMAIYYLLLAAGVPNDFTKAELGRFVEFLTGRKAKSTNAYWSNPEGKLDKNGNVTKTTSENRDLVRGFFERLGADRAVELIDQAKK